MYDVTRSSRIARIYVYNFADALNMKSAILDSLGNTTRFQKYENSTYGIKKLNLKKTAYTQTQQK
jgi:hypothetical protein